MHKIGAGGERNSTISINCMYLNNFINGSYVYFESKTSLMPALYIIVIRNTSKIIIINTYTSNLFLSIYVYIYYF